MKKFTYMDLLTQLGIGGAHPGGLIATEELLKGESIIPSTKILDAGCGTGQTSAYLYEQYKADIIALDQHPVMLDKAQKRFSEKSLPIKVMQGDIEQIPLDDQSIDYCLSESVLSFVDVPVALAEMKRILKEDGSLLAVEMTLNSPVEKKDYEAIQNFYGFKQIWEENDWRKAFEQAGFQHIEITKLHAFDEDAPITEFHPSENIHPAIFDILSIHEELLMRYQSVLNYRLIRAQK